MIDRAWLNDLKIHDLTDPALPYAVRAVAGLLGSPSPKRLTRDRPRQHGGRDSSRFYGPRVFDVAMRVRADTVEAAVEAYEDLQQTISLGDGELIFKFRRVGETELERCSVKVRDAYDPDHRTLSRTIPVTLPLESGDPRVYSETLLGGSYDPSEASMDVGLMFPLDFPLVFGLDEEAHPHLHVMSGGRYETPPVFTITGPVTNPIVENVTLQEAIHTHEFMLLAGEVAVVDVARRQLRLGGADGTLRLDLVDPALTTWFELVPGDNMLMLRGTGMVLGETLLEVAFRDARI